MLNIYVLHFDGEYWISKVPKAYSKQLAGLQSSYVMRHVVHLLCNVVHLLCKSSASLRVVKVVSRTIKRKMAYLLDWLVLLVN